MHARLPTISVDKFNGRKAHTRSERHTEANKQTTAAIELLATTISQIWLVLANTILLSLNIWLRKVEIFEIK